MLTRRSLGTGVLALSMLGMATWSAGPVLAQNWGSGAGGVDPGQRAKRVRPGEATWPVVELLAKPIESVDWEDKTLGEIIEWLNDEGERKVNIVARWDALEQVGVDEDKSIRGLRLYNTSIGEVLDEVMLQVAAGGGGKITFRGERNTIRISTAQDFDSQLMLRVYDVTDILFRVPDFSESAPQIDLSRQQSSGAGGGGSQPIFTGAGGQNSEELSEEGEQDPEQILNDLVDLIQDTVDPLNWDINGGPHRVRGYGRRSLVIYAPATIHEIIAGYFARHR